MVGELDGLCSADEVVEEASHPQHAWPAQESQLLQLSTIWCCGKLLAVVSEQRPAATAK